MKKKKLTEKQQARQNKIKTIFKWVLCGLGWSILFAGFVSLLVVGVRGCANKSAKSSQATAITTPVKPLQPNYVVNGYPTNSSTNNPYADAQVWVFLGGATESVHQGAIYTWQYKDEYENNGFVFPSAVGVNATFSRSIGTITTYLNNEVVKSKEIRYIGLSANGQYYTFASNPNDIDNTSVVLNSQDMSGGYLDKVVIQTYDFFTLDYINGNDFNCTYYYVGNANTIQLSPFTYFLNDGNEFVKTYTEPEYIVPEGGNGGLEGAFGLIYKAFTSISSFFNLQIIPGITIGTFIFVPLVVGLIIFIVKLFKR